MKTTLEIDETVMRALKRRAAVEGKTISQLVESALRVALQERPVARKLPPLPTFDGGGPPLVDVNDRSALYDLFDEEDGLVRR